jgi:hypothetical protein
MENGKAVRVSAAAVRMDLGANQGAVDHVEWRVEVMGSKGRGDAGRK